MAALTKSRILLAPGVQKWAMSYQIVRNHWNKDWKPGPYPKTPEERLAAAKKYGVHPQLYEPYPDDGTGQGDYPKLPVISANVRDPYYPWDYPELKRNFNEPIHVDEDYHCETRIDASTKKRPSANQRVLQSAIVIGSCIAVFYLLQDYKMFRPVLAKQYPGSGVVHYTYESEN